MSALEVAERALGAAPAADGALASVACERSLMLRYARSRPTQSTAVDDLTVELTVLREGHLGRASTNATDGDSLAGCARAASAAAEAAARAAGAAGTYPGFPAPEPARDHEGHDGHDAATALLAPGPGGAALAAAFNAAAAAGVEAHGIWTAGEVETAVASSSGTAAEERVTDAFMKVICVAANGRSGYASATGAGLHAIDPAALARRAAAKAAARGKQATLGPGEHTVVMEAHAVGELVDWLGRAAFNGLAHAEGRGALAGRLGTRVVAPAINLSDSPRCGATLQRTFDAEGVPKAPLALILDGVAHAVVHDTRSAAAAGARSTGHALAPGGASAGPGPTNLVLAGGGVADEQELCRGVEHGVYVTRLWYSNLVRPKQTLVTAVTRDGTFLIENGEVTRPLDDMRVTDSVLGMLSRVQALGARSVLTSDGELYGRRFATGVVCPPARVGAVRFTG